MSKVERVNEVTGFELNSGHHELNASELATGQKVPGRDRAHCTVVIVTAPNRRGTFVTLQAYLAPYLYVSVEYWSSVFFFLVKSLGSHFDFCVYKNDRWFFFWVLV